MPPNDTAVLKTKVQSTGDQTLKTLASRLTDVDKKLGKMQRNTKQLTMGFGRLGGALKGLIAGVGIREISRAADQFQLLQDRISVFTGSQESAAQTLTDLGKAASFTKTSVNALGTSFNRIAIATKELGLSTDQILASTIALQQTFRLSGATIEESRAATIQMSQGLASGQLRGQELRSVLEANAVFAGLLADELDTTRGNLIKFAEAGTITSDVVLKALSKNFDQLNKDAAKLGQTFEQTVIITLDALKFKINDLNRTFKLSEGFAAFARVLVNNFDALFISVSVLVGSLVFVKMTEQITKLTLSFKLLSSTNLIGLAITGITALTFAVIKYNEAQERAERKKPITEQLTKLSEEFVRLKKLQDRIQTGKAGFFEGLKPMPEVKKELDVVQKKIIDLIKLQNKGLKFDPGADEDGFDFAKKYGDALEALNLKAQAAFKKAKSAGPFKELNAELQKGVINLNEYRQAILASETKKLVEDFQQGKLTADQFNESLKKTNEKFLELEEKTPGFREGLIAGLKNYADSASDLAKQTEQFVGSVFGNLENQLVDFVTKGKFAFKDFAKAIIEDLARIVIRMTILAPIAQGLKSIIGSANGNVFQGGKVVPFASGGVITSPVSFPLAGGNMGVAGEKGPEAIMPLRRGPNGKLGVESSGSSTVVNVINNSSNTETQTSERKGANGEKQIEILIVDKVNKAIGDGRFDRTFSSAYGLNRRGY